MVEIPELLLERWYEETSSRKYLDVSQSGVEELSVGRLLQICGEEEDRLMNLRCSYGDSRGDKSLRREIGKLHGKNADSVVVTSGASEALAIGLLAILTSGDNLVVEKPNFRDWRGCLRPFGVDVREWTLKMQDGFIPDMSVLARLCDRRTRVVMINHPHNPSGATLTAVAFRELLEFAESRGIVVLSDEVARELILDGSNEQPPVVCLSENGMSVGSVSKSYGLPGLRIGWIVASDHLARRCRIVKENLSTHSSRLCEYLALVAIRNRAHLVKENTGILRKNADIVDAWMTANPEWCTWVRPSGGACGFPKYRLKQSSREVCRDILDRTKVLVAPGWAFGVERHFRLGLGCGEDVLRKALRRIGEYFEKRHCKCGH